MVEIDGGRLAKIEAVTMNRAAFEAVNFISEVSGELLAAELAGLSWAELSERKLSFVDVLRERLG